MDEAPKEEILSVNHLNGVHLVKSRPINFETPHYTFCQAVGNVVSSLVDPVTFNTTLSSDTSSLRHFFVYLQSMDTFAS